MVFAFICSAIPEPVEGAGKDDAAQPALRRVRIDDRLGRQQRLLEGLDRADVRLGRAGTGRHRDRRSGHVDEAAGELGLLLQVLHHRPRQHDDVGGFTSENPLLHFRREAVRDGQLVAARLLVGRRKLVEHRFERDGGEHLHLGRARRRRQQACGKRRNRGHQIEPASGHDLLPSLPEHDLSENRYPLFGIMLEVPARFRRSERA
jgi:hypothetical protein